jgi:hypothetical protein
MRAVAVMSVRSVVVFSSGLVLGVAGTALVGVALMRDTWTAALKPPAAMSTTDAPLPGRRPLPGAEAGQDLRQIVNARVAAVIAEQRRGMELDLYLDGLDRTARERGFVSALEVVPGLAAIDAAYPNDPEKGPAFARRMETLGRELGQSQVGPEDPPPGVTAHALLQAVSSTPPGPARDKLVPQALTAISQLPLAEQEEASKALDRATAVGVDAKPTRGPDELLALVGSTTDPTARAAIVSEFLGVASSLPLDEQEVRAAQLDRATALGAPNAR